MERCPACGRMTYEYDYTRQDWVCVSYACSAEGRENGRRGGDEARESAEKKRFASEKEPGFKV